MCATIDGMNRQHILSEIRRTAELNGGIPLGRKRFTEHTGIRDSDWEGKFWVRWNEAVIEAGFAPNEMQSAYPDDVLLEKLAALVRELGHYPVFRELKMKAHSDVNFPNVKTFSNRFGGKAELAGALAAWCESVGDWGDVFDLCLPMAVTAEPHEEADDTEALSATRTEHVYLMKSGKYYKIGRTNAVGRREYELSIQLPDPVTVVHTIATDDAAGIELYWHQRFGDRRKNGEWFELRREDVSAFRRRKFM